MSLRQNLVANYLSQIYVVAVGIAMVPLYIKYMGPEAYGLVGFWIMLQAWFLLLDLGLTPTIARETARFNGNAVSPFQYRKLVRAVEALFILLALIVGILLFFSSGYIAREWLQVSQLEVAEVELALQLIVVIVVCRLVSGLYRGIITGFERLVMLSAYNSVIATLRFVLVLPVMIAIDASPGTFFAYQLAVSVLELVGLAIIAYVLLPGVKGLGRNPFDLGPVRPILTFALTIAFTSTVWVVVTQTDKLVLSGILELAEYGYFTVAVLVASGIIVMNTPVSLALMPRLTKLYAERDFEGARALYGRCTQLVSVLAGSVSVTLAFKSEAILRAWTGDELLASRAAPILTLYALGNGLLVLTSFPYYIQYAKGNLRLHLIGNCIFLVILLPAIVIGATRFGSIGAGYVWLGTNLLCLALWVPFVHHKLWPGLNREWFIRDIASVVLPIVVAGFLVSRLFPEFENRLAEAGAILGGGLLVLMIGVITAPEMRSRYLRRRVI
jgi:O-antigen/teichoic acid export membrane protein